MTRGVARFFGALTDGEARVPVVHRAGGGQFTIEEVVRGLGN